MGLCLVPLLMLLVPQVYLQAIVELGMLNAGAQIVIFLTIPILVWLVSLIVLFVRLAKTRFTSPTAHSDPGAMAEA